MTTTTFAHLSDLHFGRIDAPVLETLRRFFDTAHVDEVIVTGDLTQSGRRSEFAEAAAFFDTLDQRTTIIPGNHDAPVYNLWQRFVSPWKRFSKALDRDPEPVTEDERFVFVGLNSATRIRFSLDWSTGRLSSRQITRALEEFRLGTDHRLQILGAHHPFFPEPEAGSAGRAVIPRAPAILDKLVDAGLDVLMTGHVHQGRVRSVEVGDRKIILSQAGTASSTRTRGETPSFNLLKVDNNRLSANVMRYGEESFEPEKQHAFVRRETGWHLDDAETINQTQAHPS